MATRREVLLSGTAALAGAAPSLSRGQATDAALQTEAESAILEIPSGERHVVERDTEEAYREIRIGAGAELQLEAGAALRLEPATCLARVVAEQHGDPDQIGLADIQLAIDWWATDTPVPELDEEISLGEIQALIDMWATDETVTCQ